MRYPIFLNLKNQPVVVIGAGKVALRKIRTLLEAGALMRIISPVCLPSIQGLAKAGKVKFRQRAYRDGDLAGAILVIAATDDEQVNRQVCADAKRRRVLVNCITPPAAGNFIVPAIIESGGLTIAISTGGASPALAKQIRRELEDLLRDRYRPLLKEMRATHRRAVKLRRASR
jgi:precorrin-2 dehydrogenase / sirohydrochlorin ferrochelatase